MISNILALGHASDGSRLARASSFLDPLPDIYHRGERYQNAASSTPSHCKTYATLYSTTAPEIKSPPPHHTHRSTLDSPESPKYISVPQSLQPHAIHHPYIKGILPVPRPIFRQTSLPNSSRKASPTYLAAVTPEPKPTKQPPLDPLTAWKTEQAASRRRNLREGLLELHTRKQTSDAERTARSRKRQREHERLIAMPMREDERLTAPTILSNQLPSAAALSDPHRTARVAASRANVAAHEAARKEQRREDLHELYVNAGKFITSEAQLEAEVERVFEDRTKFVNQETRGENIWHLGEPATLAQKMGEAEAGVRMWMRRGGRGWGGTG